ncbi:MAG: hypothetical protein ACRDJE_03810 [Dehalococcoidia bacterium]
MIPRIRHPMLLRAGQALWLVALLALGSVLSGSGGEALAQSQAPQISKLVIFVPGIAGVQTTAPRDAYRRAALSFQDVLKRLNCPTTPSANSPLLVCDDGIAWLPYSYSGTSGGHISPYSGAQTSQSLQNSANAMDEVVSLGLSLPGVANAQLYIVAHSLGGAISTYWAADHPNVPVITLDSPVRGIWPSEKSVLDIYCNESVGLLTTERDVRSCDLNLGRFGSFFNFPVIQDLQDPANVTRMGSANAFNFGNIADIFVPTWFAVNPASKIGAALVNDACVPPDDPLGMNHLCILAAAAPAVATYLQTGTPPAPMAIQETITVTVNLSTGSGPFDATVTASSPGLPSMSVQSQNGVATLTVPWFDWVVEASYQGETIAMGALPAADTNLTVNLAPRSR